MVIEEGREEGADCYVTTIDCINEGCSKVSSYGRKGYRANFCSKNAGTRFVDVNKKCGDEGCLKCSVYCAARINRAGFRSEHTRAGIGDVAGTNKGEFCLKSARAGMVYEKKCNEEDCLKRPSYGVSGSKKAEFAPGTPGREW